MKRRSQGLLIGIATVVLLAACSEPAPDKPAEQSPVTSAPATWRGIPSSPPPIPRPLDASKYRDKPCNLFTDEQAQALGYRLETRPGVVPGESRCMREDMSNLDLHFSIWYRYDGTDRFAKVHRREADWNSDKSTPITVVDQPAVKVLVADWCRILIGLSTTQSVEVNFGDPKVDSCDRAVRIAEAVVLNVRG